MISYSVNKLNKNILYSPLGYTLYLNFSSDINQYQISNNNLNQGQTLDKVQSVYVDNSQSSVSTTITVQKTGQKIVIPAYSILSWSLLLSQNDLITFTNTSTTNALVTIILTDRNLPAVEYSATESTTSNLVIPGNLTVEGETIIQPATASNQAVNLGQFTSSLATNGYQEFPSGLIIQWGTTPSIASAAQLEITFPITFPNAVFNINITRVLASTGSAYVFGIGTVTTSNFYAINTAGISGIGYWLAIGY